MKTITYNPETHVLVPRDLIADAKQIFCSDVEPNTNGDCLDVIEWFKAILAVVPQPEPVAVEPVGYVDYGDRVEWYKKPIPETDLYTTPQPDRTAELEAALKVVLELLPKETPGSFIGLGKFYLEHSSKFAPHGDPMNKFKIKWFNDCQEAIAKINEVLK